MYIPAWGLSLFNQHFDLRQFRGTPVLLYSIAFSPTTILCVTLTLLDMDCCKQSSGDPMKDIGETVRHRLRHIRLAIKFKLIFFLLLPSSSSSTPQSFLRSIRAKGKNNSTFLYDCAGDRIRIYLGRREFNLYVLILVNIIALYFYGKRRNR